MRLNTELVRRLGSSRFNYWFGYMANGTWVLWLLTRGARLNSDLIGVVRVVACFLAGIAFWTLAEYLLHRFVYHVIPSFLSQGHLMHHRSPRDLIGVPWWLTSILLASAYRLATAGINSDKVGPFLAGTWLGYIGYCLLHHGSHHWPMRSRYLRRVKQLHQLHHAYPNNNWGFTTNLWDIVFGTYLAPTTINSRMRGASPSLRAPRGRGTMPQI